MIGWASSLLAWLGWLLKLAFTALIYLLGIVASLKFVSWALKQHSGSNKESGAQGGQTGGAQRDEDAEDESSSHDHPDGVRLKPQKVPGAVGEIARILSAPDYYSIMELARDAAAVDVKKAYRLKQMLTHPDKNQGVAGAVEASQRVNAAYDTLGDEIRRRQYDVRLHDEETYGPRGSTRGGGTTATGMSKMAEAFDEFVRSSMPPPPEGAVYPTIDPSAYDTWGNAPDHTFRMACSCGYDHIAKKVPNRSLNRARKCTCAECGFMGQWLPASQHQVWFECSNSFMRQVAPEKYIKAYRCCSKAIYEITDWARCNGMLADSKGNPAPTNTHWVPFKLSAQDKADQKHTKQQAAASAGSGSGGAGTNPKHKGKKKGRR